MAPDPVEEEGASEEELLARPYRTSLEYLDDQFQMLMMQIKLSEERLNREMQEVWAARADLYQHFKSWL